MTINPSKIAEYLQLKIDRMEHKKFFFNQYIISFLKYILELLCETYNLEHCAWCNKYVLLSSDYIEDNEERFCSKSCLHDARDAEQVDYFPHKQHDYC